MQVNFLDRVETPGQIFRQNYLKKIHTHTIWVKLNIVFILFKVPKGDEYEIEKDSLQMINKIGEGEFGEVWKAKLLFSGQNKKFTFVAVKTLRGK